MDIEGADRMCFESLVTMSRGESAALDSVVPVYASTEDPQLLDLFEQLGATCALRSRSNVPWAYAITTRSPAVTLL